MIEHPLLFSTEMVRAILDGRKTQTRRIIKPQPYKSDRNPPNYRDTAVGDLFICPDYFPTEEKGNYVIVECESLGTYHCMGVNAFVDKHSPYGQVGDRLWVREGYRIQKEYHIGGDYASIKGKYLADNEKYNVGLTPHEWELYLNRKRRTGFNCSGRFMYKSLARIFLEITNIRVERVQDIDNDWEDCLREGITAPDICEAHGVHYKALLMFKDLWDSLNAKRGYGWDKNPWVWIIEFKIAPAAIERGSSSLTS